MRECETRPSLLRILSAAVLGLGLAVPRALAQPAPFAPPARSSPTPELRGRTVEGVRILGNTTVPTPAIRNLIRTRVGEKYDPATVQEDYQRVHLQLRKFSNVEARVEPTPTGVVVVFEVVEQKQINSIGFRGNARLDNLTLMGVVDLSVGEAIDPFRLSLGRGAIEGLYRERNYPFARVAVAPGPLAERGDVVFEVVEGPNVRVRNIEFKGARSFPDYQLRRQIKTAPWVLVFRPGRYDPEQVEEDVAALRRFYEGKGYFDVRVDRKLIWSPDQTELQIDFLIDEGPRYTVDRVSFEFEGEATLSEAELRRDLRLVEGAAYDGELLQRDIRQIVRAYSPRGYIYQPGAEDPEYLTIVPKPVFLREPGRVALVYSIKEGRAFRVGPILVKGNYKSQEKLVLREMRLSPGQLFDSGKLQDATDRLRQAPYFDFVNVTPIGTDPEYRSILVEVNEAKTATFNIGAGINSNGGVGGNLTYEQRNFDIANLPNSLRDVFSDRTFTGAGQSLRATFEPGTEATNASLRFVEPYLFDQPYSFSGEVYLRDRKREDYDDRRSGGRVGFGKRFNYVWSASINFRGEDIRIDNIDDAPLRAPEVLAEAGHNTLTGVGVSFRRDTRNPGVLPHRGTLTTGVAEFYGALGGDYSFQRFELGWDGYKTLYEDLTDRKTVLGLHANAGLITGDSVFFERFYGGGIGSVRGFEFRGISPRAGIDEDPVGGEFTLTGTAEINYPIIGEGFRGVVFADAGTVEERFEIDTIRSSVGAGVRIVLPFLGQTPIAIDLAVPLSRGDEDETQLISFTFGITQ